MHLTSFLCIILTFLHESKSTFLIKQYVFMLYRPDHVQMTFSFLFSAKTLSVSQLSKAIAHDPAPKPDLLQLHSLSPNTAPSFTADRITWVDINILQFYTTYFWKPDNAASLLSSIIHRFIPPPLFRFQRKLCKILKKCNNRRKCTVYTSKNQHFYKLGSFISGFSSKAHTKFISFFLSSALFLATREPSGKCARNTN